MSRSKSSRLPSQSIPQPSPCPAHSAGVLRDVCPHWQSEEAQGEPGTPGQCWLRGCMPPLQAQPAPPAQGSPRGQPAAGKRIALYFFPFQLYLRVCLEYSLCKLSVCSQPSLDYMETAFN